MDLKNRVIISYRVALLSGGLCILLVLLLFFNFWTLKYNEPAGIDTIKNIQYIIIQEADSDKLQNESLDYYLISRKVYLTSSWQIKTGTYLLLICGILLAITLKIHTALRLRIEKSEELTQKQINERSNAQFWLFLGGGLIFGLAFSSAFLSNDILKDYHKQISLIMTSLQDQAELNKNKEIASGRSFKGGGDIDIVSDSSILNDNKYAINVESIKRDSIQRETIQILDTARQFSAIEDYKKNHNSFRGFLGQGISYHQNIPVDWDCPSGQNVKWKVKCTKPGTNSPVIWGDKLFISGADLQSCIVSCYDRFTGILLWEREVKDISGSPKNPPEEYPETGLAAPTMAVDGNGVYAIFGTGDLIAFSLNGERIWSYNLGVPRNSYNHSSSLIVWQEKLVIQYDTQLKGRMLVVNAATGEIIWDISRPVQTSWTSPVLIRHNSVQIITAADPYITGYDINTGNELWKVEGMMGEVAASVAYDDGLVFASSPYASILCIKPEPGTSYIWLDDEFYSEIPSPVANNGLLYFPTNYGDLVCYDSKTGKKYWKKWFDVSFYSSPILVDNKLYIVDKGGTMHILKADTTGTIINEPELGEAAYATPAFADGMIYLRGISYLYCVGE